jgi:hypothetical protein
VGRACGPLHLLAFGESLADHGVHRGLGQARGDALTGAAQLAIVDQAGGIAGDVAGKLTRCPSEFAEMWAVDFQTVYLFLEEPNFLPGAMLVAMPGLVVTSVPKVPFWEVFDFSVLRLGSLAYRIDIMEESAFVAT